MNGRCCDVLLKLAENGYRSQRELAERCECSLGAVNAALKRLWEENVIDEKAALTEKGVKMLEASRPQRAVILAAGVGMRMAPLNTEVPKAFLEVHGETLIERLIDQLHQAGIDEIYVVVGFMKERFEYLIDQYNVKLIVNAQYARYNNLHSLVLAKEHLENAYILPCDIWCERNPFRSQELYAWYMISKQIVSNSMVRMNRKGELVTEGQPAEGNRMMGICYMTGGVAKQVKCRLEEMAADPRYENAFWEDALYNAGKMSVWARVGDGLSIVSINTYEQLRELDAGSAQLKNDAIMTIAKVLNVDEAKIRDIRALKKGMTNRSFLFSCKGESYIMRIPGEGTDVLINRKQEADVYRIVMGKKICDDVIYINPDNGYKITRFIHGVRVCDPFDMEDVLACMKKLRQFHEQNLIVDHEFRLFDMISFYESLWGNIPSDYKDYTETKQRVFSLKAYIDAHVKQRCLTHIDAIPDNFLFSEDEQEGQKITLIDWEYAGMQDPHVDIAMFCVYAMYDRQHVDGLIDAYFPEGCPVETRIKIYCYISVCGLLWSNWCEYKRILGVEFGEYSLRQYRFAKEYYKIASQLIEESKISGEGESCTW